MYDRFFDKYSKQSFNNLYGLLKDLEKGDDEYAKDLASRLLEKINTYYSITTVGEDEIPVISLGWFGEELRDLIYVLVTRYLLSKDDTDYFQDLYEAKLSMLQDDNYYRKIKLKHLSSRATFLSNEEVILLQKGRNILNELGEKTGQLELGDTDLPLRTWEVARILKTKASKYLIVQIPEGWKVIKYFYNYREKYLEKTEFILNNETFEVKTTDLGKEELTD